MKHAVVINLNNNNIREIVLLASSLKTFNPSIDIYGLLMGTVNNITIHIASAVGLKLIDVDKYFDQAFPWFKKHGIDSCRIASSQKPISKYTYGRLLIPFSDVLQTYDRLLYMDNDCIAVRPIDQLLNLDTKSFITICFDGMCKDARDTEMRGFEAVKKYDIGGNASDYFCPGVLLFDMAKYNAQSWQAALQYMNTFNELTYKDINEVYCDQEIVNACPEASVSTQRLVFSEFNMPAPEKMQECIFHYYCLKHNPNFKYEIINVLKNADINTDWIEQTLH